MNNIKDLIKQFEKHEYATAHDIALAMGVSDKTARSRLHEINLMIQGNGAEILSRSRYGFYLVVHDQEKWNAYLNEETITENYDEPKQRINRIAMYLLTAQDYIKTSEISDKLYISGQVVTEALRACEQIFSYYHLSLERKPYYGLRLIGSEFNKRNCIIHLLSSSDMLMKYYPDESHCFKQIIDTLFAVFHTHHIHLTEMAIHNVALYIYLSFRRYEAGFEIVDKDGEKESLIHDRAFQAAKDILSSTPLKQAESEVVYLAIYIAGMRNTESSEYRPNVIINKHIEDLIEKILKAVNDVCKIDFSGNLRLRMMLAQHLVSLDLRIRYSVPLNSDMVVNVKQEFPYAFAIAGEAISVLAQEYKVRIFPNEQSWLALIFETGLADVPVLPKMNILIVCEAGRASSQLLKYQVEKHFSKYVDHVYTCTYYELYTYNLTNIDYIFSTIPIDIPIHIPIMMIDDFSAFYHHDAIEAQLLSNRLHSLSSYYRQDLFFTDIEGASKEEIILKMCRRIQKVMPLPKDFYDSVILRESRNCTDYGYLTAIPHPTAMKIKENIVAIAVLNKPIHWERNDVQVVILTALGGEDDGSIQLFNEVTSRLITSPEMINRLIHNPEFSTLINLLSKVELIG